MSYNINPLWDNLAIDPIIVPIRWQVLKETLSEQTYKLLEQSYYHSHEEEDFCPSTTPYQMMIIQRWCRHMQLMGFSEETLARRVDEIGTAAYTQEEIELQAFSMPIAKEMRENGCTDLEILKALGVDLYQGYWQTLSDSPKSPYTIPYLKKHVFITN